MRKFAVCIVLLAAAVAMAQGPFDGTWKINTNNMQAPPKTDEFKVDSGLYECFTCNPKISIKADGADQKVTGNPYADTMAVKIIDDRNAETTSKKGDVVVGTTKLTVSADNKKLTEKWTFTNSNGKSGNGTAVLTRVGNPPKSGNMISGQWRIESFPTYSDNVGVFSFRVSGDEIAYSAPTGENYTAKPDGKDYPYHGDPGMTSVEIKKVNDHTLEEIDKRDGKVISVARMMVSADGKTMVLAVDDKLHNQQWKWTADKQETAAGK